MKKTGKGLGFGLNEVQPKSDYLDGISEGLPMPEFKPLRSYPATAYPRQSEIDAFCRAPSRFV